jgi:hypothetical protein
VNVDKTCWLKPMSYIEGKCYKIFKGFSSGTMALSIKTIGIIALIETQYNNQGALTKWEGSIQLTSFYLV